MLIQVRDTKILLDMGKVDDENVIFSLSTRVSFKDQLDNP